MAVVPLQKLAYNVAVELGHDVDRTAVFAAVLNQLDRDYAAWIAVRSIGEAATRTRSTDAAGLRQYMLGAEFKLAAFKGSPVTYRDWNWQLRQPLLITSPRVLVSVSPQKGFLHQSSVLDTLGYDRPESECRAFESRSPPISN